MNQYSKKLHCTSCMNRKGWKKAEVGTVVSKGHAGRTHYALYRVREAADIRKHSSLSHDDVLLYIGGKNEDARVVPLTEEDCWNKGVFGVSRVQTAPKTN